MSVRVLTGCDLVLPDRILGGATLIVEGDRIAEIRDHTMIAPGRIDLSGHYVVPAFIDVHVHGVEGHDSLDGPDAVSNIARRLTKYGVAAFCPTSVACSPSALKTMLAAVREARIHRPEKAARVLSAHLESNFINPEFRGAQPQQCLRMPPRNGGDEEHQMRDGETFSGADVLEVIETARPDVGIITLAPELDGGLHLIKRLVAGGHKVSLGHSGASFDEARAAIEAGATQATHLFNRMPPLGHRDPGLAGAVLASEEIAAEIICDGFHVHPAVVRTAVAAKQPSRVMAITDATAGAGLPAGSRVALGGSPITVGPNGAHLEDGTLAGSTTTMNAVFRMLVTAAGLSLIDAAIVCATTPARVLGLQGHGVIAPGAVADLAVLDRDFRVVQTYIAGEIAYSAL